MFVRIKRSQTFLVHSFAKICSLIIFIHVFNLCLELAQKDLHISASTSWLKSWVVQTRFSTKFWCNFQQIKITKWKFATQNLSVDKIEDLLVIKFNTYHIYPLIKEACADSAKCFFARWFFFSIFSVCLNFFREYRYIALILCFTWKSSLLSIISTSANGLKLGRVKWVVLLSCYTVRRLTYSTPRM